MEEHEEEEGGLSTGKKVVAGAALGVAVPAAVGVARKLMSGDEGDGEQREEDASSEPTSRERRSSPTRSSAGKKRAKPQRTREQLYKQATRLKIAGRSSMNKAQLERAIERAKAK